MNYAKHLVTLVMGIALLTFPSCDGIFQDIYDMPKKSDYGFLEVATPTTVGKIYVNASEYTKWMYIDFHKSAIDSVSIVKGGEEFNGEWDIAVHRYDAKTNNGSVIETPYSDLKLFLAEAKPTEGIYINDVDTDSTIITDMSHMMDGEIGYAKSKVNLKLSEWLKRDMSTMPPIYTLSNKVYVVKLKDNTKAAVKLSNFMNNASDKGYLTINYIYPVEF